MRLYTATEIAELIGIHPDSVYRLGRQGKIETVKVGRSVRFILPAAKREVQNDKR